MTSQSCWYADTRLEQLSSLKPQTVYRGAKAQAPVVYRSTYPSKDRVTGWIMGSAAVGAAGGAAE